MPLSRMQETLRVNQLYKVFFVKEYKGGPTEYKGGPKGLRTNEWYF